VHIVKNITVPYIAWNILENRATHRFSEAHQATE